MTDKTIAAKKNKLQQTIVRARDELSAIEGRERTAKNRKYLGKFYKLRNHYSCPRDESDYWNLYIKITGMTQHGNIESVRFQTDKQGRMEFDKSSMLDIYDEIIEISEKEYQQAARDFLKRVRLLAMGDLKK